MAVNDSEAPLTAGQPAIVAGGGWDSSEGERETIKKGKAKTKKIQKVSVTLQIQWFDILDVD